MSNANKHNRLSIHRLDPSLPLPRYAHEGDSGIDLYAAENVEMAPLDTAIIRTGIAVEIPPGLEGQVRGRSSLSVRGMLAAIGTIDAGYRGEIGVVLTNTSDRAVEILHGQRIAQLVIAPVTRCEVVEVEGLAKSERGERGFGSTGT